VEAAIVALFYLPRVRQKPLTFVDAFLVLVLLLVFSSPKTSRMSPTGSIA